MKMGTFGNARRAAHAAVVGLALVGAAGLTMASTGSSSGNRAGTSAMATDKAGEYAIDAVHSAVIFRIKHNQAAYNYGRFNGIDGVVNYDEASGVTGIKVEVDTNTVDTANKDRDNHLRSPDFFNAKQFPKITFKSTSVKKASEHAYEVAGEFTLNGVTKPLTVTLEHTGNGKTMQGGEVAGFETTFTIIRSEYGMTKYLPGVGDEVRLTVGLETVKQ